MLEATFENYPFKAPSILFKTPIYHPNITEQGEICQNVYEAEWKPTQKIKNVLEVIYSLLASPNPGDALREDLGKLMVENRAQFDENARAFTKKHAT